ELRKRGGEHAEGELSSAEILPAQSGSAGGSTDETQSESGGLREAQAWPLLNTECDSLVKELRTLNNLLGKGKESMLQNALDVACRVQSLMCEWQTYSRHLQRRKTRPCAGSVNRYEADLNSTYH